MVECLPVTHKTLGLIPVLHKISGEAIVMRGFLQQRHTVKHLVEREPKLEISIGFFPPEFGKPHGIGGGRIVGARGVENSKGTQSTSTKQGS